MKRGEKNMGEEWQQVKDPKMSAITEVEKKRSFNNITAKHHNGPVSAHSFLPQHTALFTSMSADIFGSFTCTPCLAPEEFKNCESSTPTCVAYRRMPATHGEKETKIVTISHNSVECVIIMITILIILIIGGSRSSSGSGSSSSRVIPNSLLAFVTFLLDFILQRYYSI